jgi:hypothetical protein
MHYAPATARRYRQIGKRFTDWFVARGDMGEDAGAAARFLMDTAPAAGEAAGRPAGARQDPQHLGLGRTTICAVRAAVDVPFGRALATGTPLPLRPRRLRAATTATVAALHRVAANRRERLLLVLCSGLGLRVGQMAGLCRRDIDLRRGRVWIRGCRRTLEVPVPPDCRQALARCLRGRPAGGHLFPAPAKQAEKPLSVRALENVVRRLVQRAGAPPETTFETLRLVATESTVPRRDSRRETPEGLVASHTAATVSASDPDAEAAHPSLDGLCDATYPLRREIEVQDVQAVAEQRAEWPVVPGVETAGTLPVGYRKDMAAHSSVAAVEGCRLAGRRRRPRRRSGRCWDRCSGAPDPQPGTPPGASARSPRRRWRASARPAGRWWQRRCDCGSRRPGGTKPCPGCSAGDTRWPASAGRTPHRPASRQRGGR